MKKSIIVAMAMLFAGEASAQGWMDITCNSKDVWDIPFQKVRVHPTDVVISLVPKSLTVTFSEKPNKAAPSKIYNVNSESGIVRNGSKDKIRIESMTHVGGGWYEYDFGQTLYIQKIGILVGYEGRSPIQILPINNQAQRESGVSVQPQETSANMGGNSQNSKSNVIKDDKYVPAAWNFLKEQQQFYFHSLIEYTDDQNFLINLDSESRLNVKNNVAIEGRYKYNNGTQVEWGNVKSNGGESHREVTIVFPNTKKWFTGKLDVPDKPALKELPDGQFTAEVIKNGQFTPYNGTYQEAVYWPSQGTYYPDGTPDTIVNGVRRSEIRIKNSKLKQQILGKWQLKTYDGITSTFTFLQNGTYRIHQVYKSPQTRELETISFDVIGSQWKLTDGDAILFWTNKEDNITNIKRVYTGNDISHRWDVNHFNNLDPTMKEASLTTWLGKCDGNRNYAGIMIGASYTITNIVISGNKMTAKYTAGANFSRKVTFERVR